VARFHLKAPLATFRSDIDFGIVSFHRGPPASDRVIGAGPYRLVSLTADGATLERNPYYFGTPPRLPRLEIKVVRDAIVASGKEFPVRALSSMTTSADQHCYMLNGWGWLATQVGYAGLAIFIDESEHYSLLNQRGQERADNFFKGLIYTATASRQDCRIEESELYHQQRAHPFRITERSELLLMFAMTPSASTFDYRRWLNEDQILALDGHLPARAIDDLASHLYDLHRQAYSYDGTNNHREIATGLRECLESKLINLRQMIRLTTEIYDICYANPDFNASDAVAELRRTLLGR